MEDTLRDGNRAFFNKEAEVLILVLMEDTLRVRLKSRMLPCLRVLILVLMEDTLRGNALIDDYAMIDES